MDWNAASGWTEKKSKCKNEVDLLNDVALTAHLIINTNEILISPNIGALK